jgi:hypothetical protein
VFGTLNTSSNQIAFFLFLFMATAFSSPCDLLTNHHPKAGIMGFYGRWGLPIPRRVPLSLCVAPTKVARIEASTGRPTAAQVDAVHEEVYGNLKRVYDAQKVYAGYPTRTLVVS